MEFEWDESKRNINVAKHGIDFVRAITVWERECLDPVATSIVGQETRYMALGIIGDDEYVIAVVYTLRGGARRLISARRGRTHEREYYQSQFGRGR